MKIIDFDEHHVANKKATERAKTLISDLSNHVEDNDIPETLKKGIQKTMYETELFGTRNKNKDDQSSNK